MNADELQTWAGTPELQAWLRFHDLDPGSVRKATFHVDGRELVADIMERNEAGQLMYDEFTNAPACHQVRVPMRVSFVRFRRGARG